MTRGSKPSAQAGDDVAQRFVQAATGYRRARAVDLDLLVQFGTQPVLLQIRDGAVRRCTRQLAPLPSWDVAIKADETVWLAFWEAWPKPGWHDILALRKRGLMSVEGRLQPLMANLQYVKDLLASPRNPGDCQANP